ncbi:MAG: type III polyketide synthase [Balneolaceae bacterium]
MPAFIHDIVTVNPETSIPQLAIRDMMKSKLAKDRKTEAILHRIYSQSGIQKRHTVIKDFLASEEDTFFNRALSNEKRPTTGERNELYKTESTKLFLEIGKKLLDQNPNIEKSAITHVITVSCTGFFAPGPDFEVVRGLGLAPSTQRFHIGFMGCYAAFPALKMAQSFCDSNPNATVMVICAELCTIHFQYKNDTDNLIASSVFADGASGALISAKEPLKTAFRIDQFASSLAYEGERDMAWTIGDTGFNMILSSYVPDIIASNLEDVITPLLSKLSITKKEIDLWAVHPGGRAIVDKVEMSMELSKHQITASRKVLSEYGNMSSATILFILKEILDSYPAKDSKILPMAFGPGLTIETGLLTVVNS